MSDKNNKEEKSAYREQTLLLYDTKKEQRNFLEGKINNSGRFASFTPKDNFVQNRIEGINSELKRIPTSVFPSVFARPLIFTYGLFEEKNETIVNEWKGLLGIFALADYLYLDVKTKRFDLKSMLANETREKRKRFLNVLKSMNVLKSKEPNSDENLIIDLIYINGKLIGGTFPGCLFFTAPEYSLPGNVGWKDQNGKLTDPVDYYVRSLSNEDEKKEILSKFKSWIANIRKDLSDEKDRLEKDPLLLKSEYIDKIIKILGEWNKKLKDYPKIESNELLYKFVNKSPELCFKEENELYKIFLRKIKPAYSEKYLHDMSEVIINSERIRERSKILGQEETIVALSKEILASKPPKKVWGLLHTNNLKDKHLHPVKIQNNKPQFPFIKGVNIKQFDFDNVWSNRIIQLGDEWTEEDIEKRISDDVAYIIIGVSDNKKKVFIPPFTKDILYVYTPKEIIEAIGGTGKPSKKSIVLKAEYDRKNNSIILELNVNTKGRKNFVATRKEYSLDKDVEKFESDIVESTSFLIWPKLLYEEWKDYYVYLEEKVKAYGDMKFKLFSYHNEEIKEKEIDKGKVIKYDSPPSGILCYLGESEENGTKCGLILPKFKKVNIDKDKVENKLVVSIDYGTSNTAIFHREVNKEPKELALKNMNLSIFHPPYSKNILQPQRVFLPLKDIVGPFPTLLNIKYKNNGEKSNDNSEIETISAANILFENWDSYIQICNTDKKKNQNTIKENIKWKEINYTNIFIKQLLLMLAAQSIEENSNLEIRICFPASFHPRRRNQLGKGLSNIIHEVEKETGVMIHSILKDLTSQNTKHKAISQEKMEILTESLANNKYFLNEYKNYAQAINTLLITIDVGGGSVDTSFWYRNEKEADKAILNISSIRIGGRDIAKFIKDRRVDFLEAFKFTNDESGNGTSIIKKIKDDLECGTISPVNFWLEFYERHKGDGKDKNANNGNFSVTLDSMNEAVEDVNSRIFLLVSGVLYYVGMLMTKVVDTNLEEISVGLAGNGFKLLEMSSIGIDREKEILKYFLTSGFNKAKSNIEDLEDINIGRNNEKKDIDLEIIIPKAIYKYKESVGKGLLYLDTEYDLKKDKYKTNPGESIDIIGESGLFTTEKGNAEISWDTKLTEINKKDLAKIKINDNKLTYFKDFLRKFEEAAENRKFGFGREFTNLAENVRENSHSICKNLESSLFHQNPREVHEIEDPLFIMLLKKSIEV